jgi:iron complex transport system permease protein
VVIGAIAFAIGFGLTFVPAWRILANMCLVTGALMAAAGVLIVGEGALPAMVLVTIGLALASLAARSSLLMAAAVLGISACLGARAGYWHATYALAIYEPLVTIVLFSALALVAYLASKHLRSDFERIAITAARVSVVMVNFGFWIGSLWGDRLLLPKALMRNNSNALDGVSIIPDWTFSIAWAVALIAVGVWGATVNRRWVVNVAAVFGAIHFYTQWFERLGANPGSILLGGLLMLGFALAIWRFNRPAAQA